MTNVACYTLSGNISNVFLTPSHPLSPSPSLPLHFSPSTDVLFFLLLIAPPYPYSSFSSPFISPPLLLSLTLPHTFLKFIPLSPHSPLSLLCTDPGPSDEVTISPSLIPITDSHTLHPPSLHPSLLSYLDGGGFGEPWGAEVKSSDSNPHCGPTGNALWVDLSSFM